MTGRRANQLRYGAKRVGTISQDRFRTQFEASHGSGRGRIGAVKVLDAAGRTVTVRRRWAPWPRRVRGSTVRRVTPGDSPLELIDVDDDPISLVLTAVGVILLVPAAVVVLIGALEGLVLLLLVPIYVAIRVALPVPWTIEVARERRLIGTERVRGWRASRTHMLRLAAEHSAPPTGFEPALPP